MEVEELSTIMFTNLQLLGLDSLDMQGKYKIPFNKDMFSLPNKAGSEAVLYFLFSRLNPSLCREQFRDCWPVIDKKTELQFRKVCNNWLTCIQKDEVDAHMPRVNAALLLSPGGRKFIHMLYSFSTYVIVQVMKSEHGWKPAESLTYPTLNPNTSALASVMMSSMRDSCLLEQEQFFERLHVTVTANRKWKEYTDELIKGFRGLTKSYRDVEHEKRLQVNITADNALLHGISLPAKRTLTMFDSDRDVLAVKRGQRIEKARSEWKALTRFSNNMEEAREVVRSVLDQTATKHVLDGTDMGVRVPGLLLRECNKEIHKREIDNVYNGGRLNLVSVVLLWNICLKLYKEQLKSEALPTVSSEVPKLGAQAHKHHSHLMSIQELREEMKSKTLPSLRQSIAYMQRRLCSRGTSKDAHKGSPHNELGLNLTTPTPPSVAVNRSLNSQETPTGPLAGSVYNKETPDAVMHVADKIDASVQGHTSSSSTSMSTISSLSNLINYKQRVADKEKMSQPVKEQNTKLSKTKSSSSASYSKKSVKSGPSRSALPRHTSAAPVHLQDRGKREPTNSNATPRTSKQKALDILADTIVESVMQSSPDVLTDMNDNMLSPHNELDKDAFATKNLIARSPIDSTSFETLGSCSGAMGSPPKTSPDYAARITDTPYRREVSSPLFSPVHHRHRDKGTNGVSHSPASDHTESDLRNNATLTDGHTKPANNKSKHSTRQATHLNSDEMQSTASSAWSVPSPSTAFIPEQTESPTVQFKTGVSSSASLSTSRMIKIDAFTNSHSEFETDDQIVNDLFESSKAHHHNVSSSLFMQNEPVELDSLSTSTNPVSSNENVNRNNSSFKSPRTKDSLSSHFESARAQEHLKQSFVSFSPRPSSKNEPAQENSTHSFSNSASKSPKSRLSYLNQSPEDYLSYRRPGDGQASADQALQQNKAVPNVKNNTGKDKVASTKNVDDLLSLSSPSIILPAPATPTSDKKETFSLKSESKPTPSGHIMQNITGNLPPESPALLQNFDLFSTSADDKLLDLDTRHVPKLIDFDSADEDLESEQDLNDSYVPFKRGISLESMTPTKGSASLTPSRVSVQQKQSIKVSEIGSPSTATAATKVPVSMPVSEDNIQAKLAILQQKVSDILGNSMDDDDDDSSSPISFKLPKSMLKTETQAVNLSHDDTDLINSELINTNLIGELEDLSP